MKNILIIQGHPDADSYCQALAQAYMQGTAGAGATVQYLRLRDVNFNYNLEHAYKRRTEWEPELVQAWAQVQWAHHIVWVYPTWWGGMPALLKAFIDRLLLPGFAFKYRENSRWWDRLLKGKSARIITTMDMPVWYYWLRYGAPGIRSMKEVTLGFCGFKPVKVTALGSVKYRKQAWLSATLENMAGAGKKDALR
jgi:NAD(P)H dehydrogenase (quinone)